MQFIPDTTGYLKIDLDFAGHSTYEPLNMRVEISKDSKKVAGDLALLLEGAIRDKLTVKAVVNIVPEGAIERPGAQKEKLLERVSKA